MKKIILLLFCLYAGIIISNAQTKNQKQIDGPVIKFEKMEYDYGTITQGADGNCVFKFKNTGNEPLIISDVRKSCGCTVPTWSTQPILPGQSGAIKLGYDTSKVGAFSKTITVISNANNPSEVLTIKGNVTEKK